MSTETKYQISEEQIVTYLRQKRAELQERTGEEYALVRIGVEGSDTVACYAYANDTGSATGATLDAVIDDLADRSKPIHRAARIRAEAAALITQAEVLETAARENLDR